MTTKSIYCKILATTTVMLM